MKDANRIAHSAKSEVEGALGILDVANSTVDRVPSKVSGALSILDVANSIVHRVLGSVVRGWRWAVISSHSKLASQRQIRRPSPVDQPTKDRSPWTIRKFTSHEKARCDQVQEWQKVSGADHRKAAWELVTDYWCGMKAKHPDEVRLQRSVTNIKRV